jgi:hypothetical protein
MRRLTTKQYRSKLIQLFGHSNVVEPYINYLTKIGHECIKCHNTYYIRPQNTLKSWHTQCCRKCAHRFFGNKISLTKKEIINKLKIKFSNKIVLLKYAGVSSKKSKFYCKTCNFTWRQITSVVFKSPLGCPVCSNKAKHKAKIIKHDMFVNNGNFSPTIKILGKYKGLQRRIKTQCLVCDHVWYPWAQNIKNGSTCPICNRRKYNNRFKRKYIKLKGKRRAVQGHEPTAIKWLIHQGYSENKIIIGKKIPIVSYKFNKKYHKYFPDILIKKRIFEVKSRYTLTYFWQKNQAKALACIKQGYRYNFLLVSIKPLLQVHKLPQKILQMNQKQIDNYINNLGIIR